MSGLALASLALKGCMLIDLLHRRPAMLWCLVILFIPAGELIYLAVVVSPDVLPGRRRVPKPMRLPLPQLRYRFRENPCHANHLALADGLRENGDLGEARELYERLLRGAPDDKGALYGLGRVHMSEAQPEHAVPILERLVSLRRSYADYDGWLCLAEALGDAGRHDEAAESLAKLVQSAPRLSHQVALAEALATAGQADAAMQTLEAALEDYRHSPRFIRREAREPARKASQLLGEIRTAA